MTDAERKEHLIICKTESGLFAVRPVSWAGIWGTTGLLPDSCRSLAYFENEDDANDYVEYLKLGSVEELTSLVKARDSGRMDIAPCDVGDTVYLLGYKTLRELIISSRGKLGCGAEDMRGRFVFLSYNDFGKSVFVPKEEAEKALQERLEAYYHHNQKSKP